VEAGSIPAEAAPQKNVIDLVAPSVPALLSDVDGRTVEVAAGMTATLRTAGAAIESLSMGIGARILHALLSPDFAFIFFYLGLGLIGVELLHPGVSVPGMMSMVFLVAA